MEIFELAAILSCTVFAGAAIYVSAVEHPARLECGNELAVKEFGPSYRRAAAMQASLAIIATIAGVAAGLNGGSSSWYVGALLIFLVIPFTFIAIMPTNKLLLDTSRDSGSAETAGLLVKWGQLHGVRTALGSIAAFLYTYLGILS